MDNTFNNPPPQPTITNEDLKIAIKRATVDDLQDYIKIRTEAYQNDPEAFGLTDEGVSEKFGYLQDRLMEVSQFELESPNQMFLLARKGSEVIGIVGALREKKKSDTDLDSWRGVYLYVNPSVRDARVGKELLEKIIQEVRNTGAGRITSVVSTHYKQKRAMGMYQKMGFRVVYEGSGYDYIELDLKSNSIDKDSFKNEQLPVTIRLAQPEDWEAWKTIRLEAITSEDKDKFGIIGLEGEEKVKKTYARSDEEWQAALLDKNQFVFLVFKGSEPVGMCRAMERKNEKGVWFVGSAYMRKDSRGKVFPRRGLVKIVSEIKSRGGSKAEIGVKFDNEDMIALASALGFKRTTDMGNDFGFYMELVL